MNDEVTTATELEAHIATLDPATITINTEPTLSPESDAAATVEAPDAPAPVADAATVAAVEDTPATPAAVYAELVHEVTHRSFGRPSAETPMVTTPRIGG